jgi:hypothetical protein
VTEKLGRGHVARDRQRGRGRRADDGRRDLDPPLLPGTSWSTAGGSFNATASASTSVTGAGAYACSSAALATDVQAGSTAASSTRAGS